MPLGRELVSSHRLSIQTTLVSGTVWPQFAMQVLTGGCQPPVQGKGWLYWVRDGSFRFIKQLGYDFLQAPHGNYRTMPISHRFRSAPNVPDKQTDRRTKLIQQKAALCTKVHASAAKKMKKSAYISLNRISDLLDCIIVAVVLNIREKYVVRLLFSLQKCDLPFRYNELGNRSLSIQQKQHTTFSHCRTARRWIAVVFYAI